MTWKKALLVGLVVLVVLVGLPVLMPGMGAVCHECGPAVAQACQQLAILVGTTLLALFVAALVFIPWTEELKRLLRTQSLERPPRLV